LFWCRRIACCQRSPTPSARSNMQFVHVVETTAAVCVEQESAVGLSLLGEFEDPRIAIVRPIAAGANASVSCARVRLRRAQPSCRSCLGKEHLSVNRSLIGADGVKPRPQIPSISFGELVYRVSSKGVAPGPKSVHNGVEAFVLRGLLISRRSTHEALFFESVRWFR